MRRGHSGETVNSSTDDQLLRLAVLLDAAQPVPGDLRRWLRDGLSRYFDGGISLDAALSVNGSGARARRDEFLILAGQSLGRSLSAWDRAAMLSLAIKRFRRTWPRVRSHNAWPADFDETQRHLFRAFQHGGGDVPDSPRHLLRLLDLGR